jgi:uncharacterized protein YndB with AHSA1/START domain
MDRIERSVFITATPERVWMVVTQPDHLGGWFADAGAEVDLRPGGAMVLTWKEWGTYRCTVERVEPPRLFVWSGPVHPDGPGGPGNATRVEFHLAPEGDGTRLTVVETGFASLDMPEEERRRHHADNTEGWRIKTEELRAYAETGPAAR